MSANLKHIKWSERTLVTESSENGFASEVEIHNKLAKKKKAELERDTWSSGLDFFLSCLGYAGKSL